MKKALTASAGVRLFLKDTSWESLPPIAARLTGASYDGIADQATTLAKTALLNTFFRLRTTTAPVALRPWFDFVTQVIAIGKERVLAFADAEMEDVVRFIHEHIGEFKNDYERTPAENHRGNVPPSMQGRIERMISIKSSHKRGNFQLTVTRLRDSADVLLDADIDESGDLFGHFKDLIKHKFTGGTHPHDIHELLLLEAGPGSVDLGYQLV